MIDISFNKGYILYRWYSKDFYIRSNIRRGDTLKHQLTDKDVAAIEKAINHAGATEATVKIEQGKVVVLMVEKKRIS